VNSGSNSKGQQVAADRHNHRIQALTKTGRFVREFDDFGRTRGLTIDENDVIHTSDSESTDSPDGMGEGIAVDSSWQRLYGGSTTQGRDEIRQEVEPVGDHLHTTG